MKYKIWGSSLAVLALLVGAGLYITRDADTVAMTGTSQGFGVGYSAILYKSPTCGCCEGYSAELKKLGFDVEVVSTENMMEIKEQYGIPMDKMSCHTIAIGDYVVEGHVPFEAVAKLLKEKPSIDGIGLPRMPSGTPGMPGPKRAPYEVYQISDGVASSYVII